MTQDNLQPYIPEFSRSNDKIQRKNFRNFTLDKLKIPVRWVLCVCEADREQSFLPSKWTSVQRSLVAKIIARLFSHLLSHSALERSLWHSYCKTMRRKISDAALSHPPNKSTKKQYPEEKRMRKEPSVKRDYGSLVKVKAERNWRKTFPHEQTFTEDDRSVGRLKANLHATLRIKKHLSFLPFYVHTRVETFAATFIALQSSGNPP